MQEISDEILVTIVVIGTVLLVMTAIFVVLLVTVSQKRFAHQQSQIFLSLLETQEMERDRIGADLHDSLGPQLSIIKLKASRLEMKLNATAIEAKSELIELNQLMDDAVQAIREVSHDLVPPSISKGLDAALNQFASRMSSRSCAVRYSSRGFSTTTNHIADTNIYRIVQELTNNALKHAQASLILIIVKYNSSKELTVYVKDNGCGRVEQLQPGKNGIGLTNVNNRLKMLGGFMATKNNPNGGIRFDICFNKPFWL